MTIEFTGCGLKKNKKTYLQGRGLAESPLRSCAGNGKDPCRRSQMHGETHPEEGQVGCQTHSRCNTSV